MKILVSSEGSILYGLFKERVYGNRLVRCERRFFFFNNFLCVSPARTKKKTFDGILAREIIHQSLFIIKMQTGSLVFPFISALFIFHFLINTWTVDRRRAIIIKSLGIPLDASLKNAILFSFQQTRSFTSYKFYIDGFFYLVSCLVRAKFERLLESWKRRQETAKWNPDWYALSG